jgi:hypothetical protein
MSSGADGAEEVVAGAAVVLEELVVLDVPHDVAVPAQGLLAVEMPAHHQAAAPVQLGRRVGRDRARGDVGVVDDGPHGLAPLAGRRDVVDVGLDALLDDREDLLDRSAGGGDIGPQGRLDLPDRGRAVSRRLFPVRQGCRGGYSF